MPKYEQIDELLSELYQQRKLFSALFERRLAEVSEEAVLELIDSNAEKLERLAAYGLVVRTPGHVAIDSQLLDFFSEYMEVEESVQVLHIQGYLDDIKKQSGYWLKDRQDRYLVSIKKNLRRISRTTAQNVKTLRANMEETYTTESHFEVKRDKLEDVRSQRDALQGVIRAVESMLNDDLFFRAAADEEMLQIVHLLKKMLQDSRHNLIEIQHQVITYLNHIERRAAVVDKVFRLKMLKDRHNLYQQTNFRLQIERSIDLPLVKADPLRSKLSLGALQEDNRMQELVLKVRAKQKFRKQLEQNTAGDLPESTFDAEEMAERTIDLYALKNIFLKRNGDLFTFIMHHEFDAPMDQNARVGIFCQMASRFFSEFDFPDETRVIEGIEVATIYGKREEIHG